MTTAVDPRIASDELLSCPIEWEATEKKPGSVEGTGEEGEKLGFPLSARFPSVQDIKNAYLLLSGYTEQFFPFIPYKRLLTLEEEIDEIHGEIQEVNKRWAAPVQVRAFVVPSKIGEPLTAFGIEDVRTLEVLIAIPDMVRAGLATQDPNIFEVELVGRIGDHVYYHYREYEINSYIPAAFYANTDIPLYYSLKCDLWRGNSQNAWGLTA